MASSDPRPLTARERDVLDFVLSVDDARLEPLRAQAKTAVVSGRCSCGCATIYLAVDRRLATARDLPSPVIRAHRPLSEPNLESACSLVVFIDEGRLASVEIVYYGASVPTTFPTPSTFGPPTILE